MPAKKKPKQPLHREHPAEVATGLAAAVTVLIAKVFGITDQTTFGALLIVVGAIPGAVTWFQTR